ncbi:STAS/SEC14 domain-containing protein [Maribius pontilimi]|uniref:STAS/SEC14 domain-containing protein n=1 Tax=Palleronia pontilimi TaxID=1964209 RepID=A0A934IH79_9RHOB|nr:STAS/SEC14 domain-containing protein [Palleronia pontilimi]MBJ3762530.1 STAS/SEC14 domain-containing protein [Palleronia pontilimi]
MISVEHDRDRNFTIIGASGVLCERDYAHAIPELEHAMELSSGPFRMMVRLEDFRGWEIDALWRELKFDVKHRRNLGRIAVVGESGLEEWGTKLSAPFARADMRFFYTGQEAMAEACLCEDIEAKDPPNGAA